MTVINANNTLEFQLFKILYQIHSIEDKINMFTNKYKLDFTEFEEIVRNTKEENFDLWDDYIEWKANSKSLKQLLAQKKDIESGDFSIS
jgi:hypothetical protein